jgi:DNA-directed RNA polymerase subunit M/transcription elongation factor TFIIS
MFCPACQHDKMTINKKSTMWTCEDCGYKLSADEFEDDYVFWFCDECNSYLNYQEGFDRQASRHICRNCGYENDTNLDNIKGICFDCGKIIPDPDATLCADCKQIRKKKAKEWLITAGKVVGIAAAVVGTVYLAAQTTEDDGSTDYTPLPVGDDEGGSTMNYSYGNSWFKFASDSDLDTEREKVRVAFCSAGDDFDLACELQELLWKFDAEMNERAWAGEEPRGPAFHREHGWYLPNDDD